LKELQESVHQLQIVLEQKDALIQQLKAKVVNTKSFGFKLLDNIFKFLLKSSFDSI
jgi:hypothetical protein